MTFFFNRDWNILWHDLQHLYAPIRGGLSEPPTELKEAAMRQVSGSALLTVLFVVTSGSACSSRPVEQIKVAEKAMEQAKEQRAEEFAESEWENAQQVWEQVKSQL